MVIWIHKFFGLILFRGAENATEVERKIKNKEARFNPIAFSQHSLGSLVEII